MSLAETQRVMWSAIRGGSGRAVGDLVVGTAELSAAERVEIYAGMYLTRQVEALAENFPKLAKLVREEAFHGLVADYVRAFPSEEPSIERLGRRLAEFVPNHRVSGSRCDLADLARLEWARAEVFLEADATPLGVDALARIGPAVFPRARLAFIPALRTLKLEYDVLPLWRAVECDAMPPPPRRRVGAAVVWRRRFDVFHVAVSPHEARALSLALNQRMMAEVCACFGERRDGARVAFDAIGGWAREEMIMDVCTSSSPRRSPRSASRC